jgi:hypothetical protein
MTFNSMGIEFSSGEFLYPNFYNPLLLGLAWVTQLFRVELRQQIKHE